MHEVAGFLPPSSLDENRDLSNLKPYVYVISTADLSCARDREKSTERGRELQTPSDHMECERPPCKVGELLTDYKRCKGLSMREGTF